MTDVDLGYVLDVVWIAGYFMTTDGANLIVTDLNDLFSVNPLKYGSSEVLPDPINSLLVIRNEVYAVNRYSVEVFQNVGGSLFPFRRIDGAMIPKGSIARDASCYFLDSFAFIGGGQNEGLSVWLGTMGGGRQAGDGRGGAHPAGLHRGTASVGLRGVAHGPHACAALHPPARQDAGL